jgi:hypothetical protein
MWLRLLQAFISVGEQVLPASAGIGVRGQIFTPRLFAVTCLLNLVFIPEVVVIYVAKERNWSPDTISALLICAAAGYAVGVAINYILMARYLPSSNVRNGGES